MFQFHQHFMSFLYTKAVLNSCSQLIILWIKKIDAKVAHKILLKSTTDQQAQKITLKLVFNYNFCAPHLQILILMNGKDSILKHTTWYANTRFVVF